VKFRKSWTVFFSIFLAACSSQTGVSTDNNQENPETTEIVSESTVSSLENPIQPGESIDTEGWDDLTIELLGKLNPDVDRAISWDPNFDLNLDYVLVKVSGVNKNGEKSNLYSTIWSCEASGSVSSSGVFRQILMFDGAFGLERGTLVDSGDDEVMDGFAAEGLGVYAFEKGDADAKIMSQSKHCGNDLDFVVAVGDVSDLPFIQ